AFAHSLRPPLPRLESGFTLAATPEREWREHEGPEGANGPGRRRTRRGNRGRRVERPDRRPQGRDAETDRERGRGYARPAGQLHAAVLAALPGHLRRPAGVPEGRR